jgi:hypothetical protein
MVISTWVPFPQNDQPRTTTTTTTTTFSYFLPREEKFQSGSLHAHATETVMCSL